MPRVPPSSPSSLRRATARPRCWGSGVTSTSGAVTWLSLDRQDNEPAALLAYLVASLERIEPVDPQWRRRSLGESAIGVTGAVRLIAAWVSSIRTPFLMIIDQAEAIQHPVSGDLIAAVALNLPAGCRLALASRTEPLLPMARLRSGGLVEEIAQADLALGDEEAQGLLVGAGVTLSDSEVTDLVAHMEGWPVGLYLASLCDPIERLADRTADPTTTAMTEWWRTISEPRSFRACRRPPSVC